MSSGQQLTTPSKSPCRGLRTAGPSAPGIRCSSRSRRRSRRAHRRMCDSTVRTRWPRQRSSSARFAPTPESSARISQDESHCCVLDLVARVVFHAHTTAFRTAPCRCARPTSGRTTSTTAREPVEDGERLPAVGDRDIALDRVPGRRHHAHLNPHVRGGRSIDRAVPDTGGQIRVLVLLLAGNGAPKSVWKAPSMSAGWNRYSPTWSAISAGTVTRRPPSRHRPSPRTDRKAGP